MQISNLYRPTFFLIANNRLPRSLISPPSTNAFPVPECDFPIFAGKSRPFQTAHPHKGNCGGSHLSQRISLNNIVIPLGISLFCGTLNDRSVNGRRTSTWKAERAEYCGSRQQVQRIRERNKWWGSGWTDLFCERDNWEIKLRADKHYELLRHPMIRRTRRAIFSINSFRFLSTSLNDAEYRCTIGCVCEEYRSLWCSERMTNLLDFNWTLKPFTGTDSDCFAVETSIENKFPYEVIQVWVAPGKRWFPLETHCNALLSIIFEYRFQCTNSYLCKVNWYLCSFLEYPSIISTSTSSYKW